MMDKIVTSETCYEDLDLPRDITPSKDINTPDQKLGTLRRQIGLLMHSRKCQKQYHYKCLAIKCVLAHLETCTDGKYCTFPHCVTSRVLLYHWKNCIHPHCRLCQVIPLKRERLNIDLDTISKYQLNLIDEVLKHPVKLPFHRLDLSFGKIGFTLEEEYNEPFKLDDWHKTFSILDRYDNRDRILRNLCTFKLHLQHVIEKLSDGEVEPGNSLVEEEINCHRRRFEKMENISYDTAGNLARYYTSVKQWGIIIIFGLEEMEDMQLDLFDSDESYESDEFDESDEFSERESSDESEEEKEKSTFKCNIL